MKEITSLNTHVIHAYVYGCIVEDMMKSSISSKNSYVEIEKFTVEMVDVKKDRKPTLDISYYVKKNDDETTRVKSKTVVRFKGKGDIPYKVNLIISLTTLITDEQIEKIKSYTYALTKAYLENDTVLLDLYPRDLMYPSSILESSVNVIEQEDTKYIPMVKLNNENITKNSLTNEPAKQMKGFTEEEERKFSELIDEYNKAQQQKCKTTYSTNF